MAKAKQRATKAEKRKQPRKRIEGALMDVRGQATVAAGNIAANQQEEENMMQCCARIRLLVQMLPAGDPLRLEAEHVIRSSMGRDFLRLVHP